MSKRPEAKMPEDWNDHSGWDRYFRDRLARDPVWDSWEGVGSIPVEKLPRIAADLKSRDWTSVWVPGCGLSPLPKLLARLGLAVVATDVSPAAVAFQQDDRNDMGRFAIGWETVDEGGSLAAEVHDFREDYRQDAFDIVINVKAFQGFCFEGMKRIAGVHARSLRPGRQAYFDTMNVQGERRDELEQALEDGGFVVPFAALIGMDEAAEANRALGTDWEPFVAEVIEGVGEVLTSLSPDGNPIQGVKVSLVGMKVHPVDSRCRDFRRAAILAVTEAIQKVGLAVDDPMPADLGLEEATAAGLGRKKRAAIEEIARKVVAGEDDPRLRWGPGRKRVRVLVEVAFPDRRVRGPALHVALENRLRAAGWVWTPGTVLHTYERCRTCEALPDAEGGCPKQKGEVSNSNGTTEESPGLNSSA